MTAPAADDLDRATHEPVHLVPYDPAWPAAFAAERHRLAAHLSGPVEHVGSTAVPGLSAKPVIDLLAAVDSMADADAVLPALCAAGYHTSAEFNAVLGTRRWLMRQSGGHRTHHLHLVVAGSADWADTVRFRDRLRGDPALAAAYLALKTSAAASLGADREAYTRAKGAFVAAALDQSPAAPPRVTPPRGTRGGAAGL